jgi:hypothetical protein
LLEVSQKLEWTTKQHRYTKAHRTNLLDVVAALDHFDLCHMVSPALVSQQRGNIPAQFECTVKEWGIQFETSLEALLCSATRFCALRVFKLRVIREDKHRQKRR